MNKLEYEFLRRNWVLLGNVKTSKDVVAYLFEIYNKITGENKPVTGCGRCVLNVKKRLKIEVEKYESLHNISYTEGDFDF